VGRYALILVAVAGCDATWNLDHVPEPAARDSHTFDADTDCPASYTLRLHPGSRYRVSEELATAWAQSDTCNADSSGLTHLVALETTDELAAAQTALGARSMYRWWVGAVQGPTAQTPIDAWIWVTGTPVTMGWATDEPDDLDFTETNHQEQFAFIQADVAGMVDIYGTEMYTALCECDGVPMSAEAATIIDINRQ
jgi:hypothetical protein